MTPEDRPMTPAEAAEMRQFEAAHQADALVASLSKFVNTMSGTQADALATALAYEHPTLLGQIAKAVGTGVIRRTLRDSNWKAGDSNDTPYCSLPTRGHSPLIHPEHDGRLDCETIIGAIFMSRQSLI